MKKYNWKYIKKGNVNIKISMVLCRGDKEIERFHDCGMALACQRRHSDDLENNVSDYIKEQADALTAHWNNKKFKPKTQFIESREWEKTQKCFKKQ